MKFERVKNAKRNLVFGLLLRIYTIVIPFFMRTLIIYILGIEYLGLNSLFGSILTVLNLAELGVGSAMTFALYSSVAKENEAEICATIRLLRKYYRIIGCIIAIVGLLLTPFIQKFISGDIPAGINIYILYFINLSSTVSTYWLFAYKNSLLEAHQRNDIRSKAGMLSASVIYVMQIIVLFATRNFYLYSIVLALGLVLENCITAMIASRLYPRYKPMGVLPKEQVALINGKIKDLFMTKVGNVIVSSMDSIVISSVLGLTILAIYQNYFYILTSVIGMIMIFFSSCTAGIGNSLITEDKEKNWKDLNNITFFISWVMVVCVCCFLGLYQPFIKIWLGEAYLMSFEIVILFCIYFYLFVLNKLLCMYKDAAGVWHQDRFRPFLTAGINLVLNIILIRQIGVAGIVLSTILSYFFVSNPWLLHNIFSHIFEKVFQKKYICILIKYFMVGCIGCVIISSIVNRINCGAFGTLVVRAVLCIVLSNLYLWMMYRKTEAFIYFKSIIHLPGVKRML